LGVKGEISPLRKEQFKNLVFKLCSEYTISKKLLKSKAKALDATYQALETNVTKSWIAARSNGQAENKIIDEIEQDLKKSNK
jgi:hypothetical protein